MLCLSLSVSAHPLPPVSLSNIYMLTHCTHVLHTQSDMDLEDTDGALDIAMRTETKARIEKACSTI